jgi:predicted DNA binding CopG/RHH family protein
MKETLIRTRISEVDKAAAEKKARKRKLTLSEFIRQLLRDAK